MRYLLATVLVVSAIESFAAPPASLGVSEREEFLFLLSPPPGPKLAGAIVVMWVPPPVLKYCLGKTAHECAAIDYCIRTTNRDVPMCRNLTVDVSKIAKYPPEIYPRRVLSVTYFRAATTIPGLSGLMTYFDGKPKTDFDRLSMKARLKAKIRLKRTADDDDFDLLAVLAEPPQ